MSEQAGREMIHVPFGFWADPSTGRLFAWEHIQRGGVWHRLEWSCAIEKHWEDGVIQDLSFVDDDVHRNEATE